ncbi:hypothetical protein HRS9122_07851 [Pyrenophora teres f. teres]|nr:hypothetical protein HRS9122_07851 [Pyrenophora teres f. teres]
MGRLSRRREVVGVESDSGIERHSDSPGADTGDLHWAVANHPDDFISDKTAREARQTVLASARKNRPWSTSSRKREALDGTRLSPDRSDSTIGLDRNITEASPLDSLSRNLKSDHDSRSVISAQTLHGTEPREAIQQEHASLAGGSENDYSEPNFKGNGIVKPSMMTIGPPTGVSRVERVEGEIGNVGLYLVPRNFVQIHQDMGLISTGDSATASDVTADDLEDAKPLIDYGNKDSRLRVEASAPSSLQSNGDVEGRPLRMIPSEDGMADLIIDSPSSMRRSRYQSWNKVYRREIHIGQNRKDDDTLRPLRWRARSEIYQPASKRACHKEGEIDKNHSSTDKTSYYDRKKPRSAAKFMFPQQSITASNPEASDSETSDSGDEEFEDINRREVAGSLRSVASYMQIHQMEDASIRTEDQRRTSQSASMVDANATKNNLIGILSDCNLEKKVDMVQCWKCRSLILRAFTATHDRECLNKKQRKLKEIREAKEAKENIAYNQSAKAMVNKLGLEMRETMNVEKATEEMKMEKADRPEDEELEIFRVARIWEEKWVEGFIRAGDAKKQMEVLGDMEELQERGQKETDHAAASRDKATNDSVEDHSQMSFEWGFADTTTSAPSSYANSVASIFTTESLTSSASYLSRDSGYSAVQVLTATKELLSIVLEDRVLLPIYQSAIKDPNIGPERLQRNLRRLFKVYANLLEEEATERLEYLASQLVLLKSGFLAHSIIEKLRNGSAYPDTERHDNSSDDDGDGDDNKLSDVQTVNEDAFEDLAVFREFLVGSEAFKSLRANVQAFVTPKPPQIHLPDNSFRKESDVDKTVIEQKLAKPPMRLATRLTLEKWLKDARNSVDMLFGETNISFIVDVVLSLAIDALFLATDEFFITMGLLEPILKRNMTRLRWHCNCGEQLYSDVTELRAGGIDELANHMQRTSSVKVQTAPYNQHSNNQRYIAPRPRQWVQNAVMKISSAFTGPPKLPAGLPQHSPPQSITACSATSNTSPRQRDLRLLTCMHRDRFRKVLHQDVMEKVTTDRTLLCFLQKQYLRHRGRFLHMLSLKRVKGIFFVKLRLPIGGSVDVRHHNPCCVVGSTGSIRCECIPPPPKVEPSPGAEYVCIPGPPPTYPLIPPEYLASLFTCPADVHEQDTWILDQLPKRTRDELRGQIGQPAEGWGIYYEEGLDRDVITLAILVIFVLASVLFGVLWSTFHFDVQGAFGVSSYMIACCAVFMSFFATRAEKLG